MAALVQQPDFLYANLNLTLVDAAFQQYDLADRYCLAAVRVNPNHSPTRQLWAANLAARERTRNAIFQYVAAVVIDSANPKLRNDLALLYLEAGDAAAARAGAARLRAGSPRQGPGPAGDRHRAMSPHHLG